MLERRREALLKKAKEYHKELNTVLVGAYSYSLSLHWRSNHLQENMPDAPPITVTQLTEQQASNKALEQQLKFKRAKIKTFQGLPPVRWWNPPQSPPMPIFFSCRTLNWHDTSSETPGMNRWNWPSSVRDCWGGWLKVFLESAITPDIAGVSWLRLKSVPTPPLP